MKIVEDLDEIRHINLYDYNYLLSRKFKYFKTEIISNSDVILLIVSLYEKVKFNKAEKYWKL